VFSPEKIYIIKYDAILLSKYDSAGKKRETKLCLHVEQEMCASI